MQRPRFQHLPPEKATSAGLEAAELAESAGLILDDWQRWVLEEALAERADGQWAAFEVGLIVPRQNGKGAILEALELAALFLFEERLIVHSAHKFDTAQEHFLRMQALIENCPDLSGKVAKILTANGKEAIVLRNGARLKFVARSRGAARGFSGDRIVLDEAFALPEEAIGAMLPALSARPNPQVWYASSAPHVDSHVLHGVRKRGISGDAGRLFFAEWGNDPGVDQEDRAAWAAANPAFGIRITEEFIESEFRAMEHLGDEFARERLGVPSAEDSGTGIFGDGLWGACLDLESEIVGDVNIALDVAHGMTYSSFASAGTRADGLTHVELIERHPGTAWTIARAKELAATYDVPILVDQRGPVAGLLDDLKAADVPVKEISEADYPRACATLQNKVLSGTLRHIGQPPLDHAAIGAAIRPAGDAWRWSRSGSKVDVSPLVAVTLAMTPSTTSAAPATARTAAPSEDFFRPTSRLRI